MIIECIFFACLRGTFTNTSHILGHKTHLNKFERIDIVQDTFLNYSGI